MHLSCFVITLIFLLSSFGAIADVKDFQSNMMDAVKKIPTSVGVYVVSLDKKDMLFGQNHDQLFNPASTTKLVTSAAALKMLGPDYKFKTKFYITPEKDLYIYGEGNPYMVIEDVKEIANEIKKKGYSQIRNIFFDDTYFDDNRSPGLGPKKSKYDFYTSALSLNFNKADIRISPGSKLGEPANVVIDSGEGIEIKVINKTATSSKKVRANIRLTIQKDSNEFLVSGSVPMLSPERTLLHAVSDPPIFFSNALKSALEEKRCLITGSIHFGKAPDTAKQIYEHSSKPLFEVIKGLNKFSNNFMAEQLLKSIGAIRFGSPGNTQKGVDVLKEYLNGININPDDYVIVNGSGLTYQNRLTAKQLVSIVQDMHGNHKLWPSFKDSLSIAGKDGTLKKRNGVICDRLMAKTGTLNNVSTIAGTILTDSGEDVAFAILLNGNLNKIRCHDVQDKLCEIITGFKR